MRQNAISIESAYPRFFTPIIKARWIVYHSDTRDKSRESVMRSHREKRSPSEGLSFRNVFAHYSNRTSDALRARFSAAPGGFRQTRFASNLPDRIRGSSVILLTRCGHFIDRYRLNDLISRRAF